MKKKTKKKVDRDLKIYVVGAPVKLQFRQPGHKNEDSILDAETVAKIVANTLEDALETFFKSHDGEVVRAPKKTVKPAKP
jgi:hypothetical protein